MGATNWSSGLAERIRPSRLLSHTKPVWITILVIATVIRNGQLT